jgi:hypothetical protein
VAFDAHHVFVGRRLPGLHINVHIVAKAAKEWGFGNLIEYDDDHNEADEHKGEEYRNALPVLTSTSHGLCVEIFQKGLYETVKVAQHPPRFICHTPPMCRGRLSICPSR